jgi:DNA recombination protein RmuC
MEIGLLILGLAAGAGLGALLVAWRLRDRASQLQNECTRLTTTLEQERKHADEREALLKKSSEEFEGTFKALSADALKSSNEQFLRLAKETLSKEQAEAKGELEKREQAVKNLVEPIAKSLEAVSKQVQEVEKDRKQAQGGLVAQLKTFGDDQEKLRKETAQLVTALRKPHARGQWGEMQLRRVVEMAGMIQHCDFVEQSSVGGIDGIQRPDMLVNLPGGNQIVIDAKTPMDAWLAALDAEDEETRHAEMIRHASHVKTHIGQLSRKAYWNQFKHSPELVVMFIPSEALFYAALEVDSTLILQGIEKKVILATPTTLIALLRTAAFGWRQEALTANAEEISKLGKELYDRMAKLAEHFARVGKSIDKAVEAYNAAVGSFESRVLPAARRFPELGVGGEEIGTLESVDRQTRALRATGGDSEESG